MTIPKVIGLTGGIAMGKSTMAKKLRWAGRTTGLGLWLHDADQSVHQLMAPNGAAYGDIIEAFGDVTVAGVGSPINRQKLGAAVFAAPHRRRKLERILHPLVYAQTRQFLARSARLRRRTVVLDIPLLFETNGEYRCDRVLSVITAESIQRRRALARRGMTPEKLSGILSAQVNNAVRRKHADHLIHSGAGVALAYRQLLRSLSQDKGFKRYQAGRRDQKGVAGVWPPTGRRHGFWRRPALWSSSTKPGQ